jgi:hypothetical protein
MAVHSTNIPGGALLAPFANAARRIGAALLGMSRAVRCARAAERLLALSDADLARLGLRREEVVSHVFRPYFGA